MLPTSEDSIRSFEYLRNLWSRYRRVIIIGVITIIGIIFGRYSWHWYQEKSIREASDYYYLVLKASSDIHTNNGAEKMLGPLQALQKKHASSIYATLATIISAKSFFDQGKYKESEKDLLWAKQHASGALQDIITISLASLWIDSGQYKEAKKILSSPPNRQFNSPQFHKLLGDIEFIEENYEAAQKKLKQAKELLENNSFTLHATLEPKIAAFNVLLDKQISFLERLELEKKK